MKLTMREVAYIGRMYEGLSEISLLANLKEMEDGSELFSLMEKEVIVEDELSKTAQEIMDVVANAQRCSRLFIKNRFGLVEKYTYRFNNDLVLVENDNGEMHFSKLNTMDAIREEVAELIGTARGKNGSVEKVLSHDELLALCSLLDHYRFAGLKAYLNGEESKVRHWSLESLMHHLNHNNSNSLCNLLLENYAFRIPDRVLIEKALHGLIEEGCVVENKGFALTGSYEALAMGFLMPETLMTLEILGYDPNGELLTASSLCIGAGHKDLLFVAFGNEDVEVASLSGFEVLNLVENYLNCPDFAKREAL